MEPTSSHDEIGARIAGRYRVVELLGRGGMAEVYKGIDERHDRAIAIKRCATRDPAKRKRHTALLEREYHTLAQLAHPRIIEVYDYGLDALGPYYTMELLEGQDLEHVERLPWRETCAVLRDVGSSLAILHSRGFVHRDVTLRNVHYAKDGRVKLIDFGAMVSMGVTRDTVGTPPFLAPEALQLQALDARVDLFSLGALGYRLLTGRHAFPARRFAELRDAWRSRPMSPTTLVPDVPPELSALVLRLLTLDRGGRPHAAAQVIPVLERIANLAHENIEKVSRAYLTAPTLIGRDQALLSVRRRMLTLVRGEGGLLIVRGAAGSGRSRMLDACALEGKLVGGAVLRADSRDAAGGEFGVASALCTQLFEQLPEPSQEAARLSRGLLAQVVEPLRDADPLAARSPVEAPERAVLIRELRDWFFAVIKQQRVIVLVDDIDRCDAASIAFLSAVAHRAARHHLLLAMSLEPSEPSADPRSLQLLEESATVIELPELSAAETEALMRSVFGDVTHLSGSALCIHALSNGNPRNAMALAQHLVDTGRARYRAGEWSLPSTLSDKDLPATMAASLAAQLRRLSEDALELLEALALADEDNLELSHYAALTTHADSKRLFAALGELCAARILNAGDDRYTFGQRGCIAVVQDGMTAARRSDTHLRIARVLAAHSGDALRRAHHLLAAELEDDAIELLCSIDLNTHCPPLALLTGAVAAAERLGYPKSTQHRLRIAILVNAPSFMAFDTVRDVLPVVLRQLEHDSGLTRYRQLSHLPAQERLTQALVQADAAYQSAPARERGVSVIDAIGEFGRLYGAILGLSMPANDCELLDSLPSLEPLHPLSPALPLVDQLIAGGQAWMRGQRDRAVQVYEATLRRLCEPDRAGLDEAQHMRIRLGLEYLLGLTEALAGAARAEERARTLEQQPIGRVHALRVRTLLQLAIGNTAEARKHLRRAELLLAQQGAVERFGATTVSLDLLLYARLGDVTGVQSSLRAITWLARQYRGWIPIEALAQSVCAEFQGDLPGALARIRSGRKDTAAAGNPFYMSMVACEVRVLVGMGLAHEAAALADEYLTESAEHELFSPELRLEAATAFGKAGRHADGIALLDEEIERWRSFGCEGLSLSLMYEARARIAIWMRETHTFEHFARLSAREIDKAQNPDLSARLGRLFDEAREHGVLMQTDDGARLESRAPSMVETQHETIHSRISECVDAGDRARFALNLLLRSTLSSLGYLFGVDADGRVALLASLPQPPDDPDLFAWLGQCVTEWAALHETTHETLETTRSISLSETVEDERQAYRYQDAQGRSFEASPLTHVSAGSRSLMGIVVVHVTATCHALPPEHLRTRIARALCEHGDMKGMRALPVCG